MARNSNFTFRVSADERQLIAALAAWLDRTESDAVRWLIREAARERGLGRAPPDDVLSASYWVPTKGEQDGDGDSAV